MTVAVVGLGRYGGGLGLTRHLLKQGERVKLFDLLPQDQLQEYLDELKPWQRSLELKLGTHHIEDFSDISQCYLNPAVPWQGGLAQALREQGKTLSSDIECFLKGWGKKVIGITGSNGKSTLWEMLTRLLPDWAAGGNRGISVFDMVQEDVPGCILELSSFQLERLQYRFDYSLICNFSPDHLDQHGSMEEYLKAKENITAFQRSEDVCVLGASIHSWPTDARVFHLGHNCHLQGQQLKFDDGFVCQIKQFPLPGAHNDELFALAILMARSVLQDDALLQKRVHELCDKGMPALPFRQNVLRQHGFTFVNDSKATTPESTICALKAFAEEGKTLHLICGGKEKDLEICDLLASIKEQNCRLYVIGEQVKRYQKAGLEFEDCQNLQGAIKKICATIKEGETLLFSPGTSSFDQFRNYKERGELFDSLVQEYFD